jgi:hypothetical protein
MTILAKSWLAMHIPEGNFTFEKVDQLYQNAKVKQFLRDDAEARKSFYLSSHSWDLKCVHLINFKIEHALSKALAVFKFPYSKTLLVKL